MEEGIALKRALPAECLFLNLPDRPDQGTDTQPPTAPGGVTVKADGDGNWSAEAFCIFG